MSQRQQPKSGGKRRGRKQNKITEKVINKQTRSGKKRQIIEREVIVNKQPQKASYSRAVPGAGNGSVVASLEQFAAAFLTASKPKILPTMIPNYANGMGFQKVLPIGGETGLFGGTANRLFEINPYDPFGHFLRITKEVSLTGDVPFMSGTFYADRDVVVQAGKYFPYVEISGQNSDGNTVTIRPTMIDSPGAFFAQDASQRWFANKINVFNDIKFAVDLAVGPNPKSSFQMSLEDQATALGGVGWDLYDSGTSSWVTQATENWSHESNENVGSIIMVNPSGLVEGRVRFWWDVTNFSTIGNVRQNTFTLALTSVQSYSIETYSLPLCSPEDLEEASLVMNQSSDFRLGGMAFWLQPTASDVTNGGDILAAQVLHTSSYPINPTLAFTALSTQPNMKYTGDFKHGAYGWYNADKIRDLEFRSPQDFVLTQASKMVIVVKPQIVSGTCPYLLKINAFYNYRWQSRVFQPLMTPCSMELLQRFLITGAGYCNVGCNPEHVDKLKAIVRDFASNPENQRIAKDAMRLMLPGLKGLAKGLGETFVPGWDIVSGVIEPYL